MTQKINLPINVPADIGAGMAQLEQAGYEAYLVGGCVRDALMGVTPADWDMCTSARPEEVIACFGLEKTIPTGIQHGTVTVRLGSHSVEVTTYRWDGDYTDHRHPAKVTFGARLEDDLARRDFTMNAAAWNPERGLVDRYDSAAAIAKKEIRCVGAPERRFQEDALRILRGLRFAAVLGFTVEAETARTMERHKELLRTISAERVNAELSRLVLGASVDRVMKDFAQIFTAAIGGCVPCALAYLPESLPARLAALFPVDTEMYLRMLRYDRHTVETAAALAELNRQAPDLSSEKDIKRLLRDAGKEITEVYCAVTGASPLLETVLKKEPCVRVDQLAVSGRDILSMGAAPGPKVGEILEYLLDQVIDEKLPNTKEALLRCARSLMPGGAPNSAANHIDRQDKEAKPMSKVWAVYFSPTGNTKTIVMAAARAAAETLGIELTVWEITTPAGREQTVRFDSGDLVFLGVPTYAGRVPNKVMPWLREQVTAGRGAAGVPIVTYGGRSFDDALAELGDIMEENGFILAGGGSFVCQHAFAHKAGEGRPNGNDLKMAGELGRGAAKCAQAGKRFAASDLPGNHPAGPYYVPKGIDGKPAQFLKAKPILDADRCTGCGRCAKRCPMDSIDPTDFETKAICIKCQRCVTDCPEKARNFDDPAFLSHKAMLEEAFEGERCESVIFCR